MLSAAGVPDACDVMLLDAPSPPDTCRPTPLAMTRQRRLDSRYSRNFGVSQRWVREGRKEGRKEGRTPKQRNQGQQRRVAAVTHPIAGVKQASHQRGFINFVGARVSLKPPRTCESRITNPHIVIGTSRLQISRSSWRAMNVSISRVSTTSVRTCPGNCPEKSDIWRRGREGVSDDVVVVTGHEIPR